MSISHPHYSHYTMAGTSSSFLSALSLILLLVGSATCDFDITRINAHEPSEGGVSGLNSKDTSNANMAAANSLEGMYSGVYGNQTEIIQLNRVNGKWNASEDSSYDYFEAVKITGDNNVPAGQRHRLLVSYLPLSKGNISLSIRSD